MQRRNFLAAAAAAATTGAASSQAPAQDIRGFSRSSAAVQRELEAKLSSVPTPAKVEEYMSRMAAEPHHAGSPASRAVAEYALDLFSKFGFDARIETFEALLPYPTERLLEMTAPVRYKARLAEPNFAEDPDSKDKNQLPTYNAYSASGDVTGELVYVNYGIPEDYEYLKSKGIDVKGKIAIARYGMSWRGVKPKVAAEHGAIACLIYSDPKEDGYFRGDVYPNGPFRCDQGVQRGSVMDMSIHVGDPLSPDFASEKGVKRQSLKESKVLMPIPVLPISYGDAKPLLEQLHGELAPENWRGALPITYHIGPGPAKVRLKLEFDNTNKPVHNVIAVAKGSTWPDQWVLYGNHHDAWVNGANDPISGAASLLEAARAVGETMRAGWKPKRTLVFALWDAEEFGLIGSTEWVEKHQAELREKAIVYFNSDSNGKGTLGAGASPSLSVFLEQVARDTRDPRIDKNLLDVPSRGGKPFVVGPLGSGSDYVAFTHHVGIAAANFGFGGEDNGGIYHSIFDSFNWYKRFSDGNFLYGKALAQYTATAMARMSEAPLPPFEFGRLTSTVMDQWKEVQELASQKKQELPGEGVRHGLARMASLSKEFETVYNMAAGQGKSGAAAKAIYMTERALQLPSGLPGRPWYKNALTAPGQYTGYGAKTLPGIREALELGKWTEAAEQTRALAATLETFNKALASAISLLADSKG